MIRNSIHISGTERPRQSSMTGAFRPREFAGRMSRRVGRFPPEVARRPHMMPGSSFVPSHQGVIT